MAEVVLPCASLGETLEFFTERLGFRVAAIFPADGPRTAVILGHGLRVRLEQGRGGDPGVLRLLCAKEPPEPVTAPNGTRVEFALAEPPMLVPTIAPAFVVSHEGTTGWGAGRAGMQYRDLVPGRLGGWMIASQIRIPRGGAVPDYVHFHQVQFQIIYCRAGWVRVVYEDQGPPFVMQAGDCVVQPPGIRHRVLESSDGLEVIEVTCPAEHATIADLELSLPNPEVRPQRTFAGQWFVRHEASQGRWKPWRVAGFTARDTKIAAATDGVGAVKVVRPEETSILKGSPVISHDAAMVFLFVLRGGCVLRAEGHGSQRLGSGSCAVIPAGLRHALGEFSAGLEVLEVAMPGVFATTVHADAALAG
jgi:quercetin dioxygenase-like cupin family protein